MKSRSHLSLCGVLLAALALIAGPSTGQQLAGPPASPEYKYSTPLPPGVAAPAIEIQP